MMNGNTEENDRDVKARGMAKLIPAGAVLVKTIDVLITTAAALGNAPTMNTTNHDMAAMSDPTATKAIPVRCSTAGSIYGAVFNNPPRWNAHVSGATRL